MVDVLLQETNGVQVVFANAHDAGICHTNRATTCHLKKLSENISPKKPRKTNAMVSASPGLSQTIQGSGGNRANQRHIPRQACGRFDGSTPGTGRVFQYIQVFLTGKT
jgi:hypothetical protein